LTAFEEMKQFGWVRGKRSKIIANPTAGCAPTERALDQGEPASQMWQIAHTGASGLRVPSRPLAATGLKARTPGKA
jgi:threonine synthase